MISQWPSTENILHVIHIFLHTSLHVLHPLLRGMECVAVFGFPSTPAWWAKSGPPEAEFPRGPAPLLSPCHRGQPSRRWLVPGAKAWYDVQVIRLESAVMGPYSAANCSSTGGQQCECNLGRAGLGGRCLEFWKPIPWPPAWAPLSGGPGPRPPLGMSSKLKEACRCRPLWTALWSRKIVTEL